MSVSLNGADTFSNIRCRPLGSSFTEPPGGMTMPCGMARISMTLPFIFIECSVTDWATAELALSNVSSALPALLMVK